MIIIQHPKALTEAASWKERLENMTVAHLMVPSNKPEVSLKEGKKEIQGVAQINQFLDEYESVVSGWNQDRCDMWFFDEE